MANQAPWPVTGVAAVNWVWRFSRDPIDFLHHAPARLGDLFSLGMPQWLPGRKRKLIFALSAEHHRRVLGEGSEFRGSSVCIKGPKGSALNRLREGISSRGSLGHAALRKLLWPAFSRKAVAGYEGEIAALVEQSLVSWRPDAPFDLWHEMRRLSLRLSCRLLFGNEAVEKGTALGEILQQFIRQGYFSTAYAFPVNWPGTAYRRLLRISEQVVASIDGLVKERRQARSEGTDVLSMLVQGCQEAGIKPDLVGPASFLFVASFETIANALTWTCFLLAQHPEVMHAVYAENQQALGNRTPVASELENLPVLDAVLKESLRLFPPVPMVYRTANATTELGGQPVNPGDWVICSQYVTQRRTDLFPEPNRFLPERWQGLNPDPFAYFPYGVGSHSCLGQSIGNTIMRMCISMIAQRWRLALPAGARVDRQVSITLAPRRGLPMRVCPQDGRFRAVPVRGNVREMVELEAPLREPLLLPLSPSAPQFQPQPVPQRAATHERKAA